KSASFCNGVPSIPGTPGIPGRDGRDGRDGAKGDPGMPGDTGPQGPPGPTGANGVKGEQGAPGPKEESGSSGMLANRNWRERAWKNLDDNRDHGLIKVLCISRVFIQRRIVNFSQEPVPYYNLTTACCKRWYFTFNGAECPLPLTVLCKCGNVTLTMFTVFAVLRGIVTTFTKEGCAWDSRLVIVNMESLVMPPRAGSLCSGSLLKKFLKLK
ncbi:unnamed protein product, partial [Porites lobata]